MADHTVASVRVVGQLGRGAVHLVVIREHIIIIIQFS